MKISHNWLKEYVPIKLSPEKLAELMTFHVVEVESVDSADGRELDADSRGKGLRNSALRLRESAVLNIDVLPNRAHDLNSHLGIAREIAILTKQKLTPPIPPLGKGRIKEGSKKTSGMLSVKIEDAQGCPRYIGRYVEGVKIAPSPKWLQERLEAVGLRSINNVVDATNYVMLEYGQPLHAFDAEQIANIEGKRKKERGKSASQNVKGIIVRKARKGEKFVTLDDQMFTLDGSELLIADAEKALALAGVKGGKKAGITVKTKNLILEAANFDPALIRRTSAKLNLRTDSSKQFQGGLHPVLAEKAMARLASLIQEIAGGIVYKDTVDAYPKKWPQTRVLFYPAECNALLGTDLKEAKMRKILEALGCIIKKMSSSNHSVTLSLYHSVTFLVTPPPERLDLTTPEELYEEIGRIYGWQNIKSVPPHAPVMPATQVPIYPASELIRKVLTGMGYSEHVGHTFISEKIGDLFKKSGLNLLELQNPMSEDGKYLRPILMPSLLEAVAVNAKRRDAMRIFEIGKHFMEVEGTMREYWGLGIMLYIKKEAKKHEAWYELKGLLDAFFSAHGLGDVTLVEMLAERKASMRLLLEPDGLAELRISGSPVGSIGAVSKQLKAIYDVEGVVVRAQVDLASLMFALAQEREFADIPKFPAIMRDIAVLVERGTKVETVQNVIENTGGELLFDVDIFDIYESEGMGENQESLAFHLLFQSKERTLTDAEVNKIFEKIAKVVKEQGWGIRE